MNDINIKPAYLLANSVDNPSTNIAKENMRVRESNKRISAEMSTGFTIDVTSKQIAISSADGDMVIGFNGGAYGDYVMESGHSSVYSLYADNTDAPAVEISIKSDASQAGKSQVILWDRQAQQALTMIVDNNSGEIRGHEWLSNDNAEKHIMALAKRSPNLEINLHESEICDLKADSGACHVYAE